MDSKNELEISISNQIEYYFSDSNLIKDRFLQEIIKKDKKQYILINILLSFNMIITLFKKHNIDTKAEKIEILKNVIKNNDNFKLDQYKKKFKLKKKINFEKLKNKIKEIDLKTIYVENLDNKLNENDIKMIFKECGEIKSIILPKLKNDKNKEYCFIEFLSIEDQKNSLKLDNTIPNFNFENSNNKNKVMKIYTKEQWIKLKNKFKELKKQLNFKNIAKPKNNSLKNIRLLELKFDIKKDIELDRGYLEVTTFQFDIIPDYIDFNKKIGIAILRFKNLTNLKNFLKELESKQKYFFSYKIDNRILSKDEINNYLKKFQK